MEGVRPLSRPLTLSETNRRRRRLLVAASAGPFVPAAWAQAGWPGKPVKLIVPYGPGGGVDRAARLIGQRLSAQWGQPVIVENRPGANTALAAEVVAKSEPDGHTLLVVAPAVLTVNPSLYPSLPYRPEDLAPVAMIGRIPLFVVTSGDTPATTVAALLDRGKTQNLTYASAGTGSMTHLGLELIGSQLGLKLTHVPYKGTASMLPDVVAGRVDLALSDLGPIRALVDAGKLKILAATSAAKSELLPTVPSMSEAGLQGIDVATWVGLAAPVATSADLTARIAGDVRKALGDSGLRASMLQAGIEVVPMEQAAFVGMVTDERARWKRVIQSRNIKPQ